MWVSPQDDIIDDVESFVAAAEILKERGAYRIYVSPGAPCTISFQAGSPPTLPADPDACSEPAPRPPIPKTQFSQP